MKLYIVRHGNTFDKGDIVTRVGGRTDLPLSQSGEIQAAKLAEAFEGLTIEACYSSPLKRTMQTAQAICSGHKLNIQTAEFLREIDYGPDENQPEDTVVQRLGKQALQDWETKTRVPQGWKVDPLTYRRSWVKFVNNLQEENTLVVTSNGVARFLLDALFIEVKHRKMKTGSVGLFTRADQTWQLNYWGERPPLPAAR